MTSNDGTIRRTVADRYLGKMLNATLLIETGDGTSEAVQLMCPWGGKDMIPPCYAFAVRPGKRYLTLKSRTVLEIDAEGRVLVPKDAIYYFGDTQC